ncbi:MAG: SCP2 sterol-binding domain-containing protein [Pseudomonadota bacterium]
MMLPLFFSFLEQWSVSILKADPTLKLQLSGLQGKTICIDMIDHPSVYLSFLPDRLHVETSSDATLPKHLTFRGTLPELLKGFYQLHKHGTLMGAALEISGDLTTAQRLQGVLSEFEFDWPLWITPLVGESVANRLEEGVRSTEPYWSGPLNQFRDWAQSQLEAYERTSKSQTGQANSQTFSDPIGRFKAHLSSVLPTSFKKD